ncbi:MAG: VWA domain-containing protein [Planctomycetes bacterium]|nr:VWA domain-containing protein [Planctomycetota bacterium]
MSFSHPWVLVFLMVPILLLAFVWRRADRRLALPFDHGRRRSGGFLRVVLDVAESLPHLALAIVVIVLAGPQQLGEPKSRRVLTNIELCVDVSGSMTASFGDGDRYQGAMKAIDQFLDFRKGDAFGLTFFGDSLIHWAPLTTDVSAIRCAPPFMHPNKLPNWFSGGTMIGKALLACRSLLAQREEGDRMIILISDGESFDLGNGADEEIGRKLRQDRITVYAIHAAEGEVPGEVLNVCTITGGEAFQAEDPDGLRAVFARIDQMQQTRIEKVTAETQDWFQPWCVIAASLLLASLLCRFSLRYTPW